MTPPFQGSSPKRPFGLQIRLVGRFGGPRRGLNRPESSYRPTGQGVAPRKGERRPGLVRIKGPRLRRRFAPLTRPSLLGGSHFVGEGRRSGLQELRTAEGERALFWAAQEVPIMGLMLNRA